MSTLSELSIEERDGVIVASVRGELDIAEAAGTGDRISRAVPPGATALVVDFSELQFIDSSGVAMLFSLARQLDVRRQRLRVVAPPGGLVARVLEIVDFGRAAPVDGHLDEALAELRSGDSPS